MLLGTLFAYLAHLTHPDRPKPSFYYLRRRPAGTSFLFLDANLNKFSEFIKISSIFGPKRRPDSSQLLSTQATLDRSLRGIYRTFKVGCFMVIKI